MRDNLICIGCPMGCSLDVTMENDKVVSVLGNTCRRGEDYARKELTNPTRIVTSTVRIKGEGKGVLPVKTQTDIPKDKIFACMKALQEIEVEPPIERGTVILENVAQTGVDIISTKRLL